ncbi:MAG: sporulation membrane protein YtaF [Bacillota bacterium]
MLPSIILLAVSLSLDALGVGLTYGLRKIKVPLASKLIICLFSILYAAGALAVGKSLSSIISPYISKLIGVTILLAMGFWIILQAVIKKDVGDTLAYDYVNRERTLLKVVIKSLGITIKVIKNPGEGDIDKSGKIEISESILLGLALSVDAIGVALGSALAGFHSLLIPFAVGLFQLIFLYAGTCMGTRFSLMNKISKKTISFLPGILLIILALIRMY